MNRCKMQSKLLDLDRAGLSISRVMMKRASRTIRNKKKQKEVTDLLTPSATRAYWNRFVGVQLLGCRQPVHRREDGSDQKQDS